MSDSELKITEAPTCAHCKKEMDKFDARHLDWGTPYIWVCFNDDCMFFVRGWKQMENTVGQQASYRFMITPDNGQNYALPWFGPEYIQRELMGKIEPCGPEEE